MKTMERLKRTTFPIKLCQQNLKQQAICRHKSMQSATQRHYKYRSYITCSDKENCKHILYRQQGQCR